MPLDMKHKNIGATVALIKGIHAITNGEELPNELTELFKLEAEDCDWYKFHDAKAWCYRSRAPFPCMVGNCPLGDETKPDLFEMATQIDLTGGEEL